MVSGDQILVLILPTAVALRVFKVLNKAQLLGFACLAMTLSLQKSRQSVAVGGMENVWLILLSRFGLVCSVHDVDKISV